jgi:hypothetical protein
MPSLAYDHRLQQLRSEIVASRRMMDRGESPLDEASRLIRNVEEIVIDQLRAIHPGISEPEINDYLKKEQKIEIKLRQLRHQKSGRLNFSY